MNITILGPGAVGSLYAYKLHLAGHAVSLWGRTPSQKIEITLGDGENIAFNNQSLEDLKHCDLLIVTLKAWQVQSALLPLLTHLDNDAIILFLHNGMGTVDTLADELTERPVLLGTSTHGALKVNTNAVHHTGNGQTLIGAWNQKGQQCQFVAEVFDHAFSPTHWHSNIQQALWTKLVINCAINPLTAILDCRNGQLTNEEYRAQLTGIVDEAVFCANFDGVKLEASTMLDTVVNVAQSTAQNYSSMHQDIYNKRQSEIDFINGYVVNIAAKNKIDVPNNLSLYQKIKQIEASWSHHD
ncbi:2-dehydropantoate 2-reductase [Vibrio maritimus]|uniref:2-dehydropantoate 2-reductase n=1 Tax=Vibrio maritimus TaxID=990268 RepID=UPI001F26C4A1|nr:2-dehydropantoate 2-reductase [Vibrio maritimus]